MIRRQSALENPAAQDTTELDHLRHYYDARADSYDEIYRRNDPLRQGELAAIASDARRTLAGRHVLEVACGSGYWTRLVAEQAASITAVDTSMAMLARAVATCRGSACARFVACDAFALDALSAIFDGGLCMFWLSHVPRALLAVFLDGFHRRLRPGAAVIMADNVHVDDVGGLRVDRPGRLDGFKRRTLPDGSVHEIIKNYFDESELCSLFQPFADEVRIEVGQCYWSAVYSVSRRSGPSRA